MFFFSSRRRHTRFKCDWSSDVCSSDLSAEGVPLSDTCQSIHTPCGGSHELQLLRVSPVNSPLNVCFARAQYCSDMGLDGSCGRSLLRERPSESALCSGTRKAAPTPSGAQRKSNIPFWFTM